MRILIIEDDPNDAILIEREIRRDHANLAVGHARNLPETRLALEEDPWDAVVCDYSRGHGVAGIICIKEDGFEGTNGVAAVPLRPSEELRPTLVRASRL